MNLPFILRATRNQDISIMLPAIIIRGSSFSSIKDEAINSVICPIVTRLGVHTIPAASLLIGEVTLSHFMHYGIILPSPIGIELMEFPARMIYILEDRRLDYFVMKTKVMTKYMIYRLKGSQKRGKGSTRNGSPGKSDQGQPGNPIAQ